MNRSFRSVPRFAAVLLVGAAAVTAPSRDAAAQDKQPGKLEAEFKRRTQTTDEDLRKQLLVPAEVGLNQPTVDLLYAPIVKACAQVKSLPPNTGPLFYRQMAAKAGQPDLIALPWIAGPNSELGKEKAEGLHALSVKLRTAMRASVKASDVRPDPKKLQTLLTDDEWATPAALPTITQMMQAENTPVRLLMIEMLAKIKGRDASAALAKRAIFDLAPEVRERAVKALADRPPAEYTPVLHYGLRYPWAAAADHAAEAIAALQLTDLVPDLVRLLKEPNPNLPYKNDPKPNAPAKTDPGYSVNEVVRVNHLCNCMVCHAPSLAKDDLVRGRVPLPNEDPPPLYYQAQSGLFVRADLTYLRQDFSVVQPVANAGKWAGQQRFDYIPRTRPATKKEVAEFQKLEKDGNLPKTYPQQDAVLFALQQLTGKNLGTTYDDWANGLPKSIVPPPQGTVKPDPQKPTNPPE